MGKFSNWRRQRKLKSDPYQKEEDKLIEYLAQLKPGTDEYKTALGYSKEINAIREASRESKRKISKADRGGIIGKILGIVGTIGGITALGYYEMRGNTFTGEKRKIADGLSNIVANFIRNR